MKLKTFFKSLAFGTLILFSTIFVACSSDDESNGGGDKVFVPSKLVIDRGTDYEEIWTISYDSQWRVTTIAAKYAEEGTKTLTFEYNSDGQMTKWSSSRNEESPYVRTYTFKTDSVIEWNGSYRVGALAVNSKGLATSYSHYYTSGGTTYLRSTETFSYDSSDRLIQIDDEDWMTDFIYDNNKGVCLNVNMPMWQAIVLSDDDVYDYFLYRKNNMSKVTDNGDVSTISYDVNEYGYPVKRTIDEDEDYVWEFEYTEVK